MSELLILSKWNTDYKLMSPLYNAESFTKQNIKLHFVIDQYDAPSFMKMHQQMYEAMLQRYANIRDHDTCWSKVTSEVLYHENHFSMIANLANEESQLLRSILKFIRNG